ncbi:hypothetical protein BGZ65_007347 [Modicella reniformis]|uniref:Uncharacterized protein n=1 Tax=Modicella reniformis TaxID=1440133 RepID=A0A9P6ILD4_9FUNG|nr:hypothetical protein BGZ65_007347 [Modicella reniformis]
MAKLMIARCRITSSQDELDMERDTTNIPASTSSSSKSLLEKNEKDKPSSSHPALSFTVTSAAHTIHKDSKVNKKTSFIRTAASTSSLITSSEAAITQASRGMGMTAATAAAAALRKDEWLSMRSFRNNTADVNSVDRSADTVLPTNDDAKAAAAKENIGPNLLLVLQGGNNSSSNDHYHRHHHHQSKLRQADGPASNQALNVRFGQTNTISDPTDPRPKSILPSATTVTAATTTTTTSTTSSVSSKNATTTTTTTTVTPSIITTGKSLSLSESSASAAATAATTAAQLAISRDATVTKQQVITASGYSGKQADPVQQAREILQWQ